MLSPADKAIAAAANAYWVNFARNGNPNDRGLWQWPAMKSKGDTVLDFSLTGPVAGTDPWKDRLDLIERVVSQLK